MTTDQWLNLVQYLVLALAALGLVLKALLDYLKSRKPGNMPAPLTKADVETAANAAATVAADRVLAGLRDGRDDLRKQLEAATANLVTREHLGVVVATSLKKMVEEVVGRIPSCGSKQECHVVLKEFINTVFEQPKRRPR